MKDNTFGRYENSAFGDDRKFLLFLKTDFLNFQKINFLSKSLGTFEKKTNKIFLKIVLDGVAGIEGVRK